MDENQLDIISNHLDKAQSLISEIEVERGSRFISFVSDSSIEPYVAYKLNKILRKIGEVDRLDLLIESGGGDLDTTAKIAKLIHKRAKEFNAIIPFYAKSAATFLALSADNLFLCKSGELGPVDPQVRHPTAGIWIPAHSIKEALEFIEETKDPLVKLSLTDKLDPLIIGAYKDVMKATEQYVREVLEQRLPEEKRAEAITTFTGKFRSHGYPIDGELCTKIGLCPKELEERVENKICELHENYVDLLIHLEEREFEEGGPDDRELRKGCLIIHTKDDRIIEINGKDVTSKLIREPEKEDKK